MSATTLVRPELVEAQRGRGVLATIVMPELGERVVLVPQASAHLMSTWEPDTLLGLPVDAIEPFISTQYGSPIWVTYDPHRHPGWGSGVLVVRDGLLRPGPREWDSSG